MERLNEESIRIVQANYTTYKKMLERSQRDHEIQKRHTEEVQKDKIIQFKKTVFTFLAGALCATALIGMANMKKEISKSKKVDVYFDEGTKILEKNVYRVNPTETGVAYNNNKIAKDLLKNKDVCHDEKREDDTKYLIAGVSKAMLYNMNDNMDEVIYNMNDENFKNWKEYLEYLGYDSYEEYIAGIKDELGAKNIRKGL